MVRKIFATLIVFAVILVSAAYCEDLIDNSRIGVRNVEDMNMSGLLPSYAARSVSLSSNHEVPAYNLARMKQMNPNFTTYPEAQGIIWLKHVTASRANNGGLEVTRLYVILGRRGLGGKWLNWNIPIPAKGSVDILEANIYDFNSMAKIGSITPNENLSAGIKTVNFMGLPENFIISIAWREELPENLSVEGLCWFQEDLRVWESVVEVFSPQSLAYKTFPDLRNPDVQNLNTENIYTWRRINLDPYNSSGALARIQRAGVAFSTRRGNSGVISLLRDIESAGNVTAPSEALAGFKRSKNDGVTRLIEWLRNQPEIVLAEGSPRRISLSGELTRYEKLILAKSWLVSQKVDAVLDWELPFEPDEISPLCEGMFYQPVLEVQGVKGVNFHNISDPKLLAGEKIFYLNSEGGLISRRIPSSRSAVNRLSSIMDLRLNEHGMLNGTVRVILRGGWGALMLGNNPTDGTARGAILALFPGLTNYKNVKYKLNKGTPEISFTLENKPGVGGTGTGVLAILPFFEPPAMRALGGYEAPVEVKFPFVIDQNITLGLPKNATQALVSGRVAKNPDNINYSENYQNRRHRLIADSRFELNMQIVSTGNMTLLRRYLDQWRAFAARHIPVR